MVNSEILIISLKIDYDFLKFKEMVNIKKTLMESSFFYIILKLNLTFYLGKVNRTAQNVSLKSSFFFNNFKTESFWLLVNGKFTEHLTVF